MYIAQISDSHTKRPGTLLFGQIDTYAHLKAAVERISHLEPQPDVVLHTGDLTNDGDESDYAAVADLLARLPMPVYPILGNHDIRSLARDAFGDLPFASGARSFTYAVEDHPVRILALDSLVEGKAAGRVGAWQLEWLDGALALRPDRPAIVMVHHPPFMTGIGFMDRIGLVDRAGLEEVVARHRQVILVTAGHVHRVIATRFAGTMAMTGSGTAHQVALDLRAEGEPAWTDEPPGFLLHRFAGGSLVSHAVPVIPPGEGAFSDDHTHIAAGR